jgi:hypothetical protein
MLPFPRSTLKDLVDVWNELEALADDEQKDDHNDDPHHPALLEKGKHEIKLWQTMNRMTITMTILTIWLSLRKVSMRQNYGR